MRDLAKGSGLLAAEEKGKGRRSGWRTIATNYGKVCNFVLKRYGS